MKKMLSLLFAAGLLFSATSCTKDSIKPYNKATTNAKSQSSGGTATPPSSDHQGGCPNRSGSAG